MKRKLIFLVLAPTLCILFFLSCSIEQIDEGLGQKDISVPESDLHPAHDIQNMILNENELGFEVISDSAKLIYYSRFHDEKVVSQLRIESPNIKPFEIDYAFDVSSEHWKLSQEEKVIEESNNLRRVDYPVPLLTHVTALLTSVYGKLPANTDVYASSLLVSSMSFHKSIFNTTIRSITDKEDCECTVHPFFLTGKTYFNCQEEHFYETSRLAESLEKYLKTNSSDDFALKLKQYLSTYKKERIRFDEYYGLYVNKGIYRKALENQKQSSLRKIVLVESSNPLQASAFSFANLFKLFEFNSFQTDSMPAIALEPDCSESCWLGCGSDPGCCGNYAGCCYYAHGICVIHDDMCPTCEPSWFCLPGCVPD